MSKKKKGKKQQQQQPNGFYNPNEDKPTLPKDPAAEQPQGNKDGVDLMADGTEPPKPEPPKPEPAKPEPAKPEPAKKPKTTAAAEPNTSKIYSCVRCNFQTRYKAQTNIVRENSQVKALCPRCSIELEASI